MKYPCGIINDLLPLFVDDVLSDESKQAVTEHLTECDSCRAFYAALTAPGAIAVNNVKKDDSNSDMEDKQMSESLKKVKLQINKRQRRVIAAALAVVVLVLGGWHVLFNLPIKTLDPAEVQVTAAVYPMSQIYHGVYDTDQTDGTDGAVTIYLDEEDANSTPDGPAVNIAAGSDENGDKVDVSLRQNGTQDDDVCYRLEIPAMPDSDVLISEAMYDKNGYLSVVSFTSRHTLNTIRTNVTDGTMYISAFKTTILGNRSEEYSKTVTTMEFSKIDRIVLQNDNGIETVLWENK